jgi:hypothetical protein
MSTAELLVDERGDILRATWREGEPAIDLSLWRDNTCRATFRLALDDATRLTHLVATALAGSAAIPPTAA